GGEPGTGLGLALVRAFAELHGGRMEVTSTLGQGTEVRVHLPHAGAVRPANEAGADPSAPDLAGAA
ncbi:MAG: hypothetical protein HXY25_12490, partial [Alphaproteobacteria bacterium]|nr:hypothetical protein [Alphaproteobacteria bacterium]